MILYLNNAKASQLGVVVGPAASAFFAALLGKAEGRTEGVCSLLCVHRNALLLALEDCVQNLAGQLGVFSMSLDSKGT